MSETEEMNIGMNYIKSKLESLPNALTKECCIYIIPNKIRQLNEEAYSPSVISIGPFHHGRNELEFMENLKWRYFRSFLQRVVDGSLGEFIRYLIESEGRIRGSYAGTDLPHHIFDIVKIILVDSCFIFEYFIRFKLQKWSEEDRVLLKPWLDGKILVDLVLLENQIPFFVLKHLYNMAFEGCHQCDSFPTPNFLELAKSSLLGRSNMQDVGMAEIEQVKHFIDMIRVSYKPPPTNVQLYRSITLQERKVVEHLPSASQLYEAGIKFSKAKEDKGLVHIGFENGVLEMSRFRIDYYTEIIVRNVMAFEARYCKPEGCYVTEFMLLLDFLVNTSADVDVLVRNGIIVNGLGDPKAVADMVNMLCKHIMNTAVNSHYHQVCEHVCKTYESRWLRWMTNLKREYFGTPWKIAGFAAATLLIILTFIQTKVSFKK